MQRCKASYWRKEVRHLGFSSALLARSRIVFSWPSKYSSLVFKDVAHCEVWEQGEHVFAVYIYSAGWSDFGQRGKWRLRQRRWDLRAWVGESRDLQGERYPSNCVCSLAKTFYLSWRGKWDREQPGSGEFVWVEQKGFSGVSVAKTNEILARVMPAAYKCETQKAYLWCCVCESLWRRMSESVCVCDVASVGLHTWVQCPRRHEMVSDLLELEC